MLRESLLRQTFLADISQFYKSGEKPEKKVDSKTAIEWGLDYLFIVNVYFVVVILLQHLHAIVYFLPGARDTDNDENGPGWVRNVRPRSAALLGLWYVGILWTQKFWCTNKITVLRNVPQYTISVFFNISILRPRKDAYGSAANCWDSTDGNPQGAHLLLSIRQTVRIYAFVHF